MKNLFKLSFMLVASASLITLSVATARAVELKGVFGVGGDFGGDTLFSGTYTDGSTWSVSANQGLVVNGGVVMVTGSFETQATVGYKTGGPSAKNGSITYTVVPVELMEFYRTSNLRMGLGLSYHSSPKVEVGVTGSSLNGTYKFKDAMGYVAQIGWAPVKSFFSIDLRYTAVKFIPENFVGINGKREFNGTVAGIYGSFYF